VDAIPPVIFSNHPAFFTSAGVACLGSASGCGVDAAAEVAGAHHVGVVVSVDDVVVSVGEVVAFDKDATPAAKPLL